MIVQCALCSPYFDDEFRWTICPHETFLANNGSNSFAHHPESYLSEFAPHSYGRTIEIVTGVRNVRDVFKCSAE